MKLPFIPKSVDGILSAFNKTLSDLDVVAQQQMEAAANRAAESIRLRNESEAAMAESRRAEKIADQIRGLIS